MSSLDACNLSTLQTHSVPRCIDFVSKADYWFGLPDAVDYAHPIGYLVGKSMEPWLRAKFEGDASRLWDRWAASNGTAIALKKKDEEVGELRKENREYMVALRRQTDRMLDQDEKIEQLREEKEYCVGALARQTSSMLDLFKANSSLARTADRAFEKQQEYRATIRNQERNIASLEAEVQRLRKQNAVLASTSEREAKGK